MQADGARRKRPSPEVPDPSVAAEPYRLLDAEERDEARSMDQNQPRWRPSRGMLQHPYPVALPDRAAATAGGWIATTNISNVQLGVATRWNTRGICLHSQRISKMLRDSGVFGYCFLLRLGGGDFLPGRRTPGLPRPAGEDHIPIGAPSSRLQK